MTGSLKGTVTDDEDSPLPGVTVTLTSPSMQGTKSYVSTADGDFRFPSLPPGIYSVKVELPGFQTKERPGLRVRVGGTTTILVQLTASSLEEEITVTAASPIVDVEASSIAVTMDTELITNLPARRDVLSLYQSAPATVGRDESNDYQKMASVAGGALADSKIGLDGVDLVDYSRGYVSADISWDSIEEVEMVIGGHKAEVGGVSAGYLNVVTKSGGNTFSGSLTVGGTTDSLTQIVVPEEQIEGFGLIQPQIKNYKYDIGASFGGPIIKDKVWFFIAPRHNGFETRTFFVPFTDPDGIHHPAYPLEHRDYIGLGKVTVQLTPNLKWFGMWQYNKAKETPEMWSVTKQYSPLESQQSYDDSVHTVSSVLTFILDQNSFMEARFGLVDRSFLFPFSKLWEGPATRARHTDRTTGYEWGMPDGWTDYFRSSVTFGANFTRFQDDLFGADHEFKAGVAYGRSKANRSAHRDNPYVYMWNNGEPWYYSDTDPFKGRFSIYGGPVGDQRRPHIAGMWKLGLFLQDTINIGERLTVSLGLRYDDYHGYIPSKTLEGWDDVYEDGLAQILLPEIFLPAGSTLTTPKLDDIMVYSFLAPRVGFSYDLFGSGKTILKGSVARYGETMFTSILEGMVPLTDKTVTFTWWDDNMNGELDNPPVDRYLAGGYSKWDTDVEPLKQRIAPNLQAPYTNELTLGITQEISQDFSITMSYMYKRSKQGFGRRNANIAKDSEWWIPYSTTDPGDDGVLGTGDEQDLTVYALSSNAPSNLYQVDNIDEAWRNYWGFTMIFHKRMSHGWMFNGSIAVNKTEGNYQHGYYDQFGGQNFWDPNVDINRAGRLEYDRPLIIKLMSTVKLPLDFNLSAYYRYFAGGHFSRRVQVFFPSTLNGIRPRSASVSVNAEARNNRDHMPESFMDLRVEKTFQMGGLNFAVWADVFNVFGFWNFRWSESRLAGGYIYTDGSFARFPRYGQPSAVFGAREFAFGARITF
jgi:hypothetical protein